MPKIQEVAALVAETLRIDPMKVDSHVRGLRAAGRLEGNRAGPYECADIIACCLSSDLTDATGPYHLPNVGSYSAQTSKVIESDHPQYQLAACEFGEALATIIGSDASSAFAIPDRICVLGRGLTLRAIIWVNDQRVPDGNVTHVFGYRPVNDLFSIGPIYAHLESSNSAGGLIIEMLRQGFCSDQVAIPKSINVPLSHGRLN